MEITEGTRVFVSAVDQRERIERSVRDSGLQTVPSTSEADYELRVDVGSSRGIAKSCGTKNNVRYVLARGRARIMEVKGRGATGECSPNIFDEMSRALASYFEVAGS